MFAITAMPGLQLIACDLCPLKRIYGARQITFKTSHQVRFDNDSCLRHSLTESSVQDGKKRKS